ncbi:signal peptide peptidase SppA [Berryella intestinalis]|uniref:signal peptide peptidase SppA n=1 Tax=Berryella intestinalis TaxID=1531429 RepID=UPI0009E3B1D6|nr:signal peptide peptidase SppA [Berryella intestinalis]
MTEGFAPRPPHGYSGTSPDAGCPPAPPFASPHAASPYGYPGAQGSAPYQAAPRKGRGRTAAIVAALLVVLVAVGIGLFAHVFGSADSISGDAVAVINIDGAIGYDGTSSSPEGLKSLLDRAEEDDRIKAVVLRVNSGGGTATAGEEMAQYVKEFSKPIVVSSAAINASAAYELSAMSDYIFVAKTTEIGAIGTVMQVTDLSEVMDKLGISIDSIKSAPSKDSSYGFRPLTDEEKAYYQALVDEINATFIQNVAEGRGLSLDYARSLATGLPFAGTTAVENGVADEIGTLEDAEDYAADMAGISGDYQVVDLEVPPSRASLLSLLTGSYDLSARDLTTILEEQTTNGTIAR